MSIAERIYETVKNMPEAQAVEVLDFAEYVKAKRPAQASGEAIKNLLAAMPDVGEDDDFFWPRNLREEIAIKKIGDMVILLPMRFRAENLLAMLEEIGPMDVQRAQPTELEERDFG